jgi:hypothetical protein
MLYTVRKWIRLYVVTGRSRFEAWAEFILLLSYLRLFICRLQKFWSTAGAFKFEFRVLNLSFGLDGGFMARRGKADLRIHTCF